jgi:hypothetical protein
MKCSVGSWELLSCYICLLSLKVDQARDLECKEEAKVNDSLGFTALYVIFLILWSTCLV